MKNIVKISWFIIIFFVVAIAGGIGKNLGNTINLHQKTDAEVEQLLIEASNKLNSQLPMPVQEDITLQKIYVGPGKVWTYSYSVIISYHTIGYDFNSYEFRQNLLNKFCSDPNMQKTFLKDNVQVIYEYRNLGSLLGKVIINPTDCH